MKTVLLVSIVALAGCRAAPTDAQMTALTQDLRQAFPSQIVAISFENAPPLDPPTIFIDTSPSQTREAEIDWLCNLVRPRVDAVDRRIEVESTQGSMRGDCA